MDCVSVALLDERQAAIYGPKEAEGKGGDRAVVQDKVNLE